MPEFTLNFQPFKEASTYDVHVKASRVEIPYDAQESLLNGKSVTVKVQVDPEASLREITIEKMRGHLQIKLHPGWGCLSNAHVFPQGAAPQARCTLVFHDESLAQFDGFIKDPLKVQFEELTSLSDSDIEDDDTPFPALPSTKQV